METTITIPLESYNLWLNRCADGSQEYVLLKNGVIDRDAQGRKHVQILCDAKTAKVLMECAERLCPEVVKQIQQITV